MLIQDIPRHPGTRLFKVREAFKRTLFLGFRAYIRAYIAFFRLRRHSGGPCGGNTGRRRVALRATDAGPLLNAMLCCCSNTCTLWERRASCAACLFGTGINVGAGMVIFGSLYEYQQGIMGGGYGMRPNHFPACILISWAMCHIWYSRYHPAVPDKIHEASYPGYSI